MKNKLTIVIAAIAAISFAGCASLQNNTVAQAALNTVENVVLSAATNAVAQLSTTGTINTSALEKSAIASSLNGAAALLRSLQSTSAAANPSAVTTAIQQGTGNTAVAAAIAPVVSAAVSTAARQGASPSAANEAAASALDQAAAKSQ